MNRKPEGGQTIYRVTVVHINHVVPRQRCCAARVNFPDLLLLVAYLEVDSVGGDLNAFSFRYYNAGRQQIAGSLEY